MKRIMSAVVVSGALICSTAFAAGLAVDLQSARGTGMAAALSALVDDSSGIYFNPAGIAQGVGIDGQLGDTLIIPFFNIKTAGGQEVTGARNLVPPPHVYATYGITDEWTVGIGVFSPFGLAVTWPEDYPGRFIVTSADLKTYYINPTVAYRYGPFRIGAGVDIVRATVDLKKRINVGPAGAGMEPDVELGAGAWGVGGNVGIQVDVIPKLLTLAAAYRSFVKINFDGDAHFNNVPPPVQGSLFDQTVHTSFSLPDAVTLGVAWHALPNLAFDFDTIYFGWQRLGAIDIRFDGTPALQASSFEAKNWKHTWNYHLGAEYTLDEHWQFRLGFLYDPSPSPNNTLLPDIPDATRTNYAAGVTYHLGVFHADFGYQFIYFFNRTSTSARESSASNPFNPASYNATAQVFSFTVGAKI